VVKIGTGAVSWSFKLQTLVALSTTEAEHISAVKAGKKILWMCEFMEKLGYNVSCPSVLWMDNQSAIAVSKNPEQAAFCSLTTMSSANLFAALATPAPAITSTPPFRAGLSILGSKRPCPLLSLPPKAPWAPPVPLPVDNVPDGSEYSVFDIQNIFCYCWFINCNHLIANILSATKDNDGQFIWVDFLSQFHTSLIKRMVTLLPPGVAVSCGKKILFVFLLEILTGDEGIKPEGFWHARKKCN
jgi:hypothetical protein